MQSAALGNLQRDEVPIEIAQEAIAPLAKMNCRVFAQLRVGCAISISN